MLSFVFTWSGPCPTAALTYSPLDRAVPVGHITVFRLCPIVALTLLPNSWGHLFVPCWPVPGWPVNMAFICTKYLMMCYLRQHFLPIYPPFISNLYNNHIFYISCKKCLYQKNYIYMFIKNMVLIICIIPICRYSSKEK